MSAEPMLDARSTTTAVAINDPEPETRPRTRPTRRRGHSTLCRLLCLLDGNEVCMLLMATLATGVSSLGSMALPVFTGELVGAVTSDKSFSDECKATPAALAHCRRIRLGHVLEIMGFAFLVAGVALAIGFFLFRLAGERLVARLRRRLFSCFVSQDIAFFDVQKTGELMNRLSSDCTALQTTLTRSLGEGMNNLVQIGVGLTLMMIASPILTLMALGAVPLIAIFAAIYGVFVAKISERYQSALADASEVAQETLSSIRTVRSFAKERHEQARYASSIGASYDLGRKRAAAFGAFIGLTSGVVQFALVVVLWFGCNQVIDGKLDFGQLTSFLLLAIYSISSISGLMGLFSAIMSALGASRRIFELMDTVPTLRLDGGDTLHSLRGGIEMRNVGFAYPSRPDCPVLRGVSLTVQPGQTLALCGSSGGGKSSVVALLERFYDPSSGSIEVDGVALTSLDPSWWRSQLALVAQEPVLFNGSVLENLRYGRADASRDAAVDAAATANAHEFVSTFTEGYDTKVGERGVRLSGGQKQRLAIARALLVDPKVLLLDEATSALDTESEALVQAAIDKLMQARTTVVIAHRLSTIRDASCISVLDKGCVVESGTHDELLAKKGVYERLGRRQTQATESA
jgi:ABC-type multidrug transport system fused ATPase/permease subunit